MMEEETLAELEERIPGDDPIEEVLSDVNQVMQELANLDLQLENAADLECVRKSLPTDPARAVIIEKSLPPPLRDTLEYVHPSGRQDGYWRRSRDRTSLSELSDAELKQRHAFHLAAEASRGEDGVTSTEDGRVISRTADQLGETMKGTSFSDEEPEDPDRGRDILSRLLDPF